jgi:hypothetical protein
VAIAGYAFSNTYEETAKRNCPRPDSTVHFRTRSLENDGAASRKFSRKMKLLHPGDGFAVARMEEKSKDKRRHWQ